MFDNLLCGCVPLFGSEIDTQWQQGCFPLVSDRHFQRGGGSLFDCAAVEDEFYSYHGLKIRLGLPDFTDFGNLHANYLRAICVHFSANIVFSRIFR